MSTTKVAPLVVAFAAVALVACKREDPKAVDAPAPTEVETATTPPEVRSAVAPAPPLADVRESSALRAPRGATVTDEAEQPTCAAVDGDLVVWADARRGALMAAPLAGGRLRPLVKGLSLGTGRGRVVALDAEHAYVIAGGAKGSVLRVDRGGGKAKALTRASPAASDLVALDEALYFLDRDDDRGEASLRTVAKDGGEVRELAKLPSACGLVGDASGLAWVQGHGTKATIGRIALDGGGGPTTVAPASGAACSLAMDEKQIVWVRTSTDDVLATDRATGASRVLAKLPRKPIAVARGANAFFAVTEMFPRAPRLEATVWRLDAAPVAVARGGRNPSIAASASGVVMTEYDDGGGAIRRVP